MNWDIPLVLCEGAFDAIAIRRNAVPLFGKSIQSKLEKKIIGNSVKKLYIVLDSDAISNAIGLSKKFMSYGIQTHLVDLGDEDPSEMGYERINQKIYDTPPLDLRKLMEYQLFNMRRIKYIDVGVSDIGKIYHIADVHIRNLQRHKEYREVFSNLYGYILSTMRENDIIYIK